MNKKIIYLIILLFSISSSFLFAQNEVKIDSLTKIIQQKNIQDTIKLDVLWQLAKLHKKIDYDKMQEYSTQLLKLSQELDDEAMQIEAYILLSMASIKTDEDLNVILDFLDQGLTINTVLNDSTRFIRLYDMKGKAYAKVGVHDKAYSAYQKGFILAEKMQDTSRIISLANNMAIILKREKNYSQAKTNLIIALQYAEQLQNSTFTISVLVHNLGALYTALDSLDLGKSYYERALSLDKELKDRHSMVITLQNIASINFKQKKFASAEQQFTEAYQIANDLKYNSGLILTLLAWSECAFQQKHYQRSLQKLEEVKKILGKNGELQLQMSYYKKLSNNYEVLGDYKLAFENYKIYHELHDSIYQEESSNTVAELETKYQVQQKEAAIKLLEAEQESAEEQSRNNRNIAIGLVLTLFLASTFSIAIYQTNQQKQKLLQKDFKNQEIILTQTQKLQKQALTKEHFYANAAHELQTPLTIINGIAKKLTASNSSNLNISNDISLIGKSTQQLHEKINQILSLSKVDNFKLTLNKQAFDLFEFLAFNLKYFQSLLNSKKIKVDQFNIAKSDVILYTDLELFHTVIKNVISNAIKYSKNENGKITITYESDKTSHTLQVKDNGIGIPENELDAIFDRYYQASTQKAEGGFGIGLAICKEYMQLLGGSITVESVLEVGSNFTIKIPRSKEASLVTKDQLITFPESSFTAPIEIESLPVEDQQIPHILIVEDNIEMCQYLKSILSEYYSLKITYNGKDAIDYLKTNTPELIITDWMMPHIDGVELVQYIKNDKTLNAIPLLMLSARDFYTDKLRAIRIGVDDYLLKPFEAEELKHRVSYLLSIKEHKTEALIDLNDELNNPSLMTSYKFSTQDQMWLLGLEEKIKPLLNDPDLDLIKIAKTSEYSLHQITRKIKRLTGFTAKRYIREFRLWQARQLLETNQSITVKEVSYAVGFKSQKYFARIFKDRFGKYPSEYLN